MNNTSHNYKPSRFMHDAIMESIHAASLGFTEGDQVANIARSGQLGIGIRTTKLDGATPAVFKPAIAVVLNTPAIMDPWPELKDMLRSLVETHAKSITGIDVSYTTETGETIVGHDGQSAKVPTRTTRAPVNPSLTCQEYAGLPVWNLIRWWQFAMEHPDTNMSSLSAIVDQGSSLPAWFYSAFSMSVMFILPDPTGLPDRIYDAVIVNNMFPTESGEMGMERTLGTSQVRERTINFTGVIQHNAHTKLLGKKVAAMLAAHRVNFDFALPGMAGSVDPDVAIDEELRKMGGLEYEIGNHDADGTSYANSNSGSQEGVHTEFQYKGDGDNVVGDGGSTWFADNYADKSGNTAQAGSDIPTGHAGESDVGQ